MSKPMNAKEVNMRKETAICNHAKPDCPNNCHHRIPHVPILDYWTFADQDGLCTQFEERCGYRKDEPITKCIYGGGE